MLTQQIVGSSNLSMGGSVFSQDPMENAAGMWSMAGGVGSGVSKATNMGMLGLMAGSLKYGNYGKVGGALGMAGRVAMFGGMIPATAGMMGAEFAGKNVYQGAQDYFNTNRYLSQAGGKFGGAGGAQGFSQADKNQIYKTIRELSTLKEFGGEVGKALDSLKNFDRMGLMQGVRGAKEFSKRFKEAVEGTIEVSEVLGATFKNAQKMVASLNRMGINPRAARGVAQGLRATADATGLTVNQLHSLQQEGGAMGYGLGGAKVSGYTGAGREINLVNQMYRGGGLSEGMLQAGVGIGGVEGMAQASILSQQAGHRIAQSRFGRKLLSRGVFAKAFGKVSRGRYTGALDQEMIQQAISGQLSFDDLRGMGEDKYKELDWAGRESFLLNKQQLSAEAGSQLGGLGWGSIFSKTFQDRYGDSYRGKSRGEAASAFFMRVGGMDRRQALLMSQMVQQTPGAQRDVVESQYASLRKQAEENVRRRREEGQDVWAGMKKVWREGWGDLRTYFRDIGANLAYQKGSVGKGGGKTTWDDSFNRAIADFDRSEMIGDPGTPITMSAEAARFRGRFTNIRKPLIGEAGISSIGAFDPEAEGVFPITKGTIGEVAGLEERRRGLARGEGADVDALLAGDPSAVENFGRWYLESQGREKEGVKGVHPELRKMTHEERLTAFGGYMRRFDPRGVERRGTRLRQYITDLGALKQQYDKTKNAGKKKKLKRRIARMTSIIGKSDDSGVFSDLTDKDVTNIQEVITGLKEKRDKLAYDDPERGMVDNEIGDLERSITRRQGLSEITDYDARVQNEYDAMLRSDEDFPMRGGDPYNIRKIVETPLGRGAVGEAASARQEYSRRFSAFASKYGKDDWGIDWQTDRDDEMEKLGPDAFAAFGKFSVEELERISGAPNKAAMIKEISTEKRMRLKYGEKRMRLKYGERQDVASLIEKVQARGGKFGQARTDAIALGKAFDAKTKAALRAGFQERFADFEDIMSEESIGGKDITIEELRELGSGSSMASNLFKSIMGRDRKLKKKVLADTQKLGKLSDDTYKELERQMELLATEGAREGVRKETSTGKEDTEVSAELIKLQGEEVANSKVIIEKIVAQTEALTSFTKQLPEILSAAVAGVPYQTASGEE